MSEHVVNGSAHGRSMMELGAALDKSLKAYAGAAAATGVSLLALASTAEARIIYTPATVKIRVSKQLVPLDLNHDGIADFSFLNTTTLHTACLRVRGKAVSNEVWGRGHWFSFRPGVFASALRPGSKVRPSKSYFRKGTSSYWLMLVSGGSGSGGTFSYGQWGFTENRYLGLKFTIDGQVHFGWARLSVYPRSGLGGVTLTGYAYETIPNKPIITGKTTGPDVITLAPASLGHLAQGASGISVWREKK
jgi:hypothetical protein